jgi:hypothetical protein
MAPDGRTARPPHGAIRSRGRRTDRAGVPAIRWLLPRFGIVSDGFEHFVNEISADGMSSNCVRPVAFAVRIWHRSAVDGAHRRHLGCGCSSVVEHDLAKVGVEGSSPFARSRFSQFGNPVDRHRPPLGGLCRFHRGAVFTAVAFIAPTIRPACSRPSSPGSSRHPRALVRRRMWMSGRAGNDEVRRAMERRDCNIRSTSHAARGLCAFDVVLIIACPLASSEYCDAAAALNVRCAMSGSGNLSRPRSPYAPCASFARRMCYHFPVCCISPDQLRLSIITCAAARLLRGVTR